MLQHKLNLLALTQSSEEYAIARLQNKIDPGYVYFRGGGVQQSGQTPSIHAGSQQECYVSSEKRLTTEWLDPFSLSIINLLIIGHTPCECAHLNGVGALDYGDVPSTNVVERAAAAFVRRELVGEKLQYGITPNFRQCKDGLHDVCIRVLVASVNRHVNVLETRRVQ
jgi:hypothetical protein